MATENKSFINTEVTARNAAPVVFVLIMTLLVGYLLVSNIRLNQRVARLEERGARMGGAGRWGGRRMRGSGMMGGAGMMGGPGAAGGPQTMGTPGAAMAGGGGVPNNGVAGAPVEDTPGQ